MGNTKIPIEQGRELIPLPGSSDGDPVFLLHVIVSYPDIESEIKSIAVWFGGEGTRK
jgi:hypothetical protein